MEAASGLCGSTNTSSGYSTPEKAGTNKRKRARAHCGGVNDSGSSPRTPSGAAPCESQQSPPSVTSGWAGGSPAVRTTRAAGGAKRQLLGTNPVAVANVQDAPPCPARHKRGKEHDAAQAEPLDGADRTSCMDAAAPDRADRASGVPAAAPAAARAASASSRKAPAKATMEARECAAAEPGSVTAKPAAAAEEPVATAAAAAAAAEELWRALLAMDDAGRRRAIQDRQTDGVDWAGAAWHDEMEMRFYRRPSRPHPQPTPRLPHNAPTSGSYQRCAG